jgi:hypothetical protein
MIDELWSAGFEEAEREREWLLPSVNWSCAVID